MKRKTDSWHTPSERRGPGDTVYTYRVVRLQSLHDLPDTTASFDWTQSDRLLRKAGWTPGQFRKKVREVYKTMLLAGELDVTSKVSPQLWQGLLRLVATA